MAISLVASTALYATPAFGPTDNYHFQKPGNLQTGDYIFFFVFDPAQVGTNTPTGFTLLMNRTEATLSANVWYKYISNAATEPSEYVVFMGSSTTAAVHALVYRGVRTPANGGPWGVNTFTYTAGAGTIVCPSLTAGVGDVISIFHYNESSNWATFSDSGVPAGAGPTTLRTFVTTNETTYQCTSWVSDRAMLTASGSGGTTTADIPGTSNVGAETFTLVAANTAPNAPALTGPANNAVLDRSITQRFSWVFSDNDPGNTQGGYDIQYRVVGSGTWTVVNNAASSNEFHDFAGNTFAVGDYEWQVRTKDNIGATGAYSSSRFFSAGNVPATPNITAPLTTVSNPNTSVTWTAPTHTAYQLRTVANNAGAPDENTIYTDTGEITDSSATSRTVNFPVNGRTEWIQFRVKNTGLWSAWDSEDVTVSFTPPSTPTVVLTPNNTTGVMTVAITNPGGGAALAYNEVWVDDGDGLGYTRRATGLAANATYTYRLPRSGRDYASRIFARAVATNSATADSTHL